MKRSIPKRLPRSRDQIALELVRQATSSYWDDPEYWEFGQRGDIIHRLRKLGPVARRVWLASTFTDPHRTRLAIWFCTAKGRQFLDDRFTACADLPRIATYQGLANVIVEFAVKRFGDSVVEDMANDAWRAVTDNPHFKGKAIPGYAR